MADELFFKKLLLTQKTQNREDRKTQVHIAVEIDNILTPIPKKELIVRLTDEKDLFFLYTLRLNEEDFQSLKVQQGLLVDFGAFPQKFIDLLELCLREEQKEAPKYIIDLVSNGASTGCTTNLNIIETNPFKHLTHLSLKFLFGSDADIKKYLANCLKNLKDQNQNLLHKLEHTEGDLSRQLLQTQEALSSRTQELDSLKSEWSLKTSDMSTKYTQEVTAEKEKAIQMQSSYHQRLQKEKAELEQAHIKIVRQMEGRIYELENSNKDLTDCRYKSESLIRELRSKVSVSEEEVQRSRQELSSLRQNRLGLDADVQEQSRLASQLHTRVAVLEQEVKDKEQVMQRTSDLLGSHQEQKRKLDEEVERKKRHVVKLEASIKTMSDELVKGNEIIKKLQGDIKSYHTKLKLRNQVTTEQEKLLTAKNREMEELRQELSSTKTQLQDKSQESQKLGVDLEATLQKLDESRQLLKTNENVINWLNKQVNDIQLSQQRHGPFELNSTASSAGTGPKAMHNFSAPSYSTTGRLPQSSGTISYNQTHGQMRMPAPRQPQVSYNPGPARQSSVPQPLAKSSPIGSIPEEKQHTGDHHASPPHLQSQPKTLSEPFLDSKYLQRGDDHPVRTGVSTGGPSPIHFTPPAISVVNNATRIPRDIVLPHTQSRTSQPPLASAYFPGSASTS